MDIEKTDEVLNDIISERIAQDAEWGDQSNHLDELWHLILSEEVGEVAEALLECKFGTEKGIVDVKEELVQVAAVAVAWIEAINIRLDE